MFICAIQTFRYAITGSGNGKDFWIHYGLTLEAGKWFHKLLVKVFLPAQLIVLVLVVWALWVAVTLQVWVDAGVGPGAVEELFTCARKTIKARRGTGLLTKMWVIKPRLINGSGLQPGGGVSAYE